MKKTTGMVPIPDDATDLLVLSVKGNQMWLLTNKESSPAELIHALRGAMEGSQDFAAVMMSAVSLFAMDHMEEERIQKTPQPKRSSKRKLT